MVAQPQTMGVADFMAMPDDGNRHEYVRGEIRSMPPPKGRHGVIETRISMRIAKHLLERAGDFGWLPEHGIDAHDRLVGLVAGGEFGIEFALPDDPHQIRGADCVYIPPEQLAELGWDGTSYFPAVPWLVVEVISPSDSALDVAERVQDYLTGGARRVWCVYPPRRTIHIHAPDGPTRVLRSDEILVDEELLPGFSVPVALLV
jgi:Uma2 family endonuclease